MSVSLSSSTWIGDIGREEVQSPMTLFAGQGSQAYKYHHHQV
jgi:hypothetical protein